MALALAISMYKDVPLAVDALRMNRKYYHMCDQLSGKVR